MENKNTFVPLQTRAFIERRLKKLPRLIGVSSSDQTIIIKLPIFIAPQTLESQSLFPLVLFTLLMLITQMMNDKVFLMDNQESDITSDHC